MVTVSEAVYLSAETLTSACLIFFLILCIQAVSGPQPQGSGCVAPANNSVQGVKDSIKT